MISIKLDKYEFFGMLFLLRIVIEIDAARQSPYYLVTYLVIK